jgi:hypothetical protein
MEFIDSLSLGDIFDLGGVWDRAKRIFTDPIDRLIQLAKNVVNGIIDLVKDAILRPLAALAAETRGWDLLTAVLGKNPITGDAVPRNADTLIGGFMKLINQTEVWDNMKKARAVPRAWAWFQGAMEALIGFVSEIPGLAIAAFKSLELFDIVLVPRAIIKVGRVFANFLGRFISWAGNAVWNLLEIIFDSVSPGAWGYIKKTGGALKSILRNPLPFVGNLVKAAKLGFSNFAGNFLTHLKAGLINWLTGSLPGIYIPKSFDLKEIVKFVLSVLGLSWANVRQKLVKATNETIVKALETTFDIVVTLVRDGPAAAWEKIKEQLSNLKEMAIGAITDFVVDTVVKKAIPKLIAMFIPGAGFISAIISIYDTVMVFVQKIKQIMAVVTAFIDSIVAIANGVIGAAAAKVESILANLLSLAIAFLAGFAGLGKVADKIMGVINKIRAPIDKAIDWLVNWIVTAAKKLFAAIFSGKKPDTRTDAQKAADLKRGVSEADQLLAQESLTADDVSKRLPAIQKTYRLTRLAVVTDASTEFEETDHVEGTVNPDQAATKRKKTKKDGPTSITIVRSTFTLTTKWNLMERDPEMHKADVKGKGPRLKKQLDRRHVISSQTMAAHYEAVLNKEKKWAGAKKILEDHKETVKNPLSNRTIEATAQERHKNFFNYEKNLFIGDASENRSIGAETDIPSDWAQQEWRKHFKDIKSKFALSSDFAA